MAWACCPLTSLVRLGAILGSALAALGLGLGFSLRSSIVAILSLALGLSATLIGSLAATVTNRSIFTATLIGTLAAICSTFGSSARFPSTISILSLAGSAGLVSVSAVAFASAPTTASFVHRCGGGWCGRRWGVACNIDAKLGGLLES